MEQDSSIVTVPIILCVIDLRMYVFFIYLTIAMPIQRIVTTTQKITKRVPIELMAYDMFRGKIVMMTLPIIVIFIIIIFFIPKNASLFDFI